MKKIILLLTALVMPLSVHALATSETFNVGDSVSVALYEGYESEAANGIGFHVLKESKAGEDTVTLIYDGAIKDSMTIYDEAIPDENHFASTVLEESVIGQKLQQLINQEGKRWRIEDQASLLSAADLLSLGITKNANNEYEIPAKYSFLAPDKGDGIPKELYNYWTSIPDGSASTTSVYMVEYNEERTTDDDIWAKIVSKDISSITDNVKGGIRPVVVVKKEYILCNNSKPTEAVDTGLTDYILPLAAVLVIAGSAIVYTKKKNAFNQI